MKQTHVYRVVAKLALLACFLIGVYFGGEALGKRRMHRKIVATWNSWFWPTEEVDPFASEPFGANPFGAVSDAGNSSSDPDIDGPFALAPSNEK